MASFRIRLSPRHEDDDHLRAAYALAIKESRNPRTKVSALIVDEQGATVAAAANTIPRGVTVPEDKRLGQHKEWYRVHAERGAVYDAARRGVRTEGCTMYMPWLPCCDCAHAIIQAGIRRLVTHTAFVELATPAHWRENLEAALAMLEQAGVIVETVDKELGVPALIDETEHTL